MKSHRFDTISFVFGLLFVGLGALFVLSRSPWLALVDFRWGWVIPAIAIGIGLVIVRSLFRQSRHGATPGDALLEEATDLLADTEERDADDGEPGPDDLIAAYETLSDEVPPPADL